MRITHLSISKASHQVVVIDGNVNQESGYDSNKQAPGILNECT